MSASAKNYPNAVHRFNLTILHFIFSLGFIISSSLQFIPFLRRAEPLPLLGPRTKLPQHLALILIPPEKGYGSTEYDEDDETMLEAMLASATNAVSCASQVGVKTLTVFDRRGLLKTRFDEFEGRVNPSRSTFTPDVTPVEDIPPVTEPHLRKETLHSYAYPTPPLSDESRSASSLEEWSPTDDVLVFDYHGSNRVTSEQKSPFHKNDSRIYRRLPAASAQASSSSSSDLKVYVASAANGTPSLAHAARYLARTRNFEDLTQADISISDVESILLAELPAPQLIIIHRLLSPSIHTKDASLGVEAFPPWQLRLAEFYQTSPRRSFPTLFSTRKNIYTPIDERCFREALDEYAEAQMREGK